MKKTKRLFAGTFKKTVSAAVCLSLLSAVAAPQGAYAFPAQGKDGAQDAFFNMPSAGKITSAGYYGDGGIIINIQDLHCHGEVQRNIARIIGHLDSRYGLEHVYLEGASEDVDTLLLSNIAKSELGAATLEKMVDEGYLNGTEYYSAVSNKNKLIKATEDKKVYDRNIVLLNEIINLEPHIDAVSRQLMYEIKSVRQEYANDNIRRLSRLVKRFENSKISSEVFYTELLRMARAEGIETENKYKNINGYVKLIKTGKINHGKVSEEFKVFLETAKLQMPYKEFTDMSQKSNSFSDIETISRDLFNAAKKYEIFETKELNHLKRFFSYLEFNNEVNPMEFAREERELKEALYSEYGSDKYGAEVLWLSEFIPTIKGYFTANITAQELENFKNDFNRFKRSWAMFFPGNTANKLDIYAGMLEEYHGNNLKRDEIFADIIKLDAGDSEISVDKTNPELELTGKNIKVVVTGGFHSNGLESILKSKKINYVIISPKITKETKTAYDLYLNVIRGYRSIEKNAINVKPFMNEAVNESMPKLAAVAYSTINTLPAFSGLNEESGRAALEDFINDFAGRHNSGGLLLAKWTITEFSKKGMAFEAEYVNKNTGETVGVRKYAVKDGKLIDLEDNRVGAFTGRGNNIEFLPEVSGLFRNTGSALWRILNVFIIPLAEEIVFRYLPFAGAGILLTNPAAFVPLALTAVVGAGIFTFGHFLLEKAAIKLNPLIKKRNLTRIFFTTLSLSAIYILMSAMFPQAQLIALSVTSILHIYNNLLASRGKIKNPIMSLLGMTEKSREDEVSARLNDTFDKLQSIFNKRKDRFTDHGKRMFEGILDNLEKAKDQNTAVKYRSVQKELSRLSDLMKGSGETFNSEHLNSSFISDIIGGVFDAYYDISAYVNYNDTENSLSDKLFYDFMEISLNSSIGRSGTYKRYMHKIAGDKYREDKDAGLEMMKEMFKKREHTERYSGDMKTFTYTIEHISYQLENASTYDEVKDYLLNKEWYDLIDNDELLWFAENIAGLELPKFKKWLEKQAKKASGVKIDSPEEVLSNLDELIVGLKKAFESAEIKIKSQGYLQKMNEEALSGYKNIIKELEVLKDSGSSADERYAKASELIIRMNDIVISFSPVHFANFIGEAYSAMAETAKYIETEDGTLLIGKLLDNLFNVILQESYVGPIRAFEEISATAYEVDKAIGIKYIQQAYEERNMRQNASFVKAGIISKPKLKNTASIEEARYALPNGWNAVLADEELEDFFDAIDIDYEGPAGRSKKFSRINYLTDIVRIFSKFPQDVRGSMSLENIVPVVIRTKKNKGVSASSSLSKKFDYYNRLLSYNADALAELNANHDNALFDSLDFLEKMIDNLQHIDRYDFNHQNARIALNAIKADLNNGLTPEKIKKHKSVKYWSKIENIRELHTLINAVHQQAIASFMAVRDGKIEEAYSEIDINPDAVEYERDKLKIYNFSEQPLSRDALEFISMLPKTAGGTPLIMKDDNFIWSFKIGVHSIDVMINLNDPDEGIRVSYNDSGRGDGNRLRVSLFASEMANLGMDIIRFDNNGGDENMEGCCGFRAAYNVSDRANPASDFMEIFEGVIKVIYSSRNLDYRLEGREDDDGDHGYVYGKYKIPVISDADFKNMKTSGGKMPEMFKGTQLESEWAARRNIKTGWLSDKESHLKNVKGKEAVYDYLELEGTKRNDGEIIRMFASGKIGINQQTGELEMNKSYVPMKNIITAIKDNRGETFDQAQLLNLLNYDLMNFRSEGYIGDMLALNGFLRTREGFISVCGIVDRERKRLKCAYTEFVDIEGNRKALKYAELLKMLKDEGFTVERQQMRTAAEKKETLRQLEKEIPANKSGLEIKGMGISSGAGKYTSGKITYDRDKVNGESIWIVGYTTPDDIEKIEQTKGLVTTSGGQLSHANISAREKNKPAVLIKEKWRGGNIEVTHFIKSGEEKKEGKYNTVAILEEKLLLKEGQRVLINGDNGTILVFDGVLDSLLDEIQDAVNENNFEKIAVLLSANINNDRIEQIIEFIYYQCFGKEEHSDLLAGLFTEASYKTALTENFSSEQIGKAVKKFAGLNRTYIEEVIGKVETIINNIDSITDVNTAYNLVLTAQKIVDSIRLSDKENLVTDVDQRLAVLKKEKLKDVNRFIADFTRESGRLIAKESLGRADLEKTINMIEKAKVWRNFHSYRGISNIVKKLERKADSAQRISAEKDFEKLIKSFDEIYAGDASEYGSKTTELAKIARYVKDADLDNLNVRVPSGAGIGKSVFKLLAPELTSKGLLVEFNKAVSNGNSKEAQRIAEEIRNIIKTVDNEEFKKVLNGKFESGKKYAVRSSGIGEDGAASAFAGMGRTNLNKNPEEIYAYIKDSWISFYEFRSVEYMAQNKQPVEPALLVQEMAEDVAKGGVIFSKNNNGDMTIEVVPGLGEGVVSGRIEPDHITMFVDSDRVEYKRAIGNTRKLISLPGGGIAVDNLKPEEKINRVLDNAMIESLSSIASGLEKDSGYPVDIEFAIDTAGNIFILQRRPITTFVVGEPAAEVKRTLAVKAGDTNGKKNNRLLMRINHPGAAAAVEVYYGGSRQNVTDIIIDRKHGDLISNERFISEILERINTDKVVRERLNKNIPIKFARVNSGEIAIEPVLFDTEKMISEDMKRVSPTSVINEILSAA